MDWLIEALCECSAAAEPFGLKLALEPINRYETTLINNAAQGLELIERVGAGQFRPAARHVPHEHRRTLHPRQPPANGRPHLSLSRGRLEPLASRRGHLDWQSILRALFATGYAGFVSGEFMPVPDAATGAQRQSSFCGPWCDALAFNSAYRAWRALLRLDQPVPSRTDQELAAEVERHYRWNFAVNLMDGASFWFGASFISASTILPLFISKLTPNPLPLGLLAVIAQSAWFLPQLFTANAVERLARRKPVIVNLGLFTERLPLWGLIAAAMLATRSPLLAMTVFFRQLCRAWCGRGNCGLSLARVDRALFPGQPARQFYRPHQFPGRGHGRAGRGVERVAVEDISLPDQLCIHLYHRRGHDPVELVLSILDARAGTGCDGSTEKQPRVPGWTARRPASRPQLSPLFDRADAHGAGSMGSGFVTVAAVQRWHVPDATVGIYTAVLLVGQTVANLAFGLLADRFGHKLCLEISAVASALAFGLAWLAASAEWYYGVFALSGIASSAIPGSAILIVMNSVSRNASNVCGDWQYGRRTGGHDRPLIGAGLAG